MTPGCIPNRERTSSPRGTILMWVLALITARALASLLLSDASRDK